MSSSIFFFVEEVQYQIRDKTKIRKWIDRVIRENGASCGEINIILCSDDYLLKMNREHLSHDYYTDIITFDYSADDNISGDLFISIERVKENAHNQRFTISEELHRVIIHGVLHLLGYKDKSTSDKSEMKRKEDESLSLRAF